MQSENQSKDQSELTFIEKARRAQLVACAIDTIATLGYAQASLAQIARRAKVSKGVISYHFAGKDELIQQVIAEIFERGAAFMRPRIEAESTPTGMLRAYIESNLAFMRTYPNHILALVEIVFNFLGRKGSKEQSSTWLESAIGELEQLLQWGQKTGEFREFDTRVMAVAIRNAIDGVPPQMATRADLDLDVYARELVELFDRATRE